MKKTTAASTLLVAATVTALGAGPVTAAPPDPDTITYTATTTEHSTVLTTTAGSMVAENGVFTIRADNGTILAGTELSFRIDDFVFPIAADITGRTATLTPQLDARHARYAPVALPFEDQAPWKNSYDREQAAWARMTTTITTGATIGTLIGGIGGAAVGCLIGGIAGATVASAAIVGLFGAFLPAAAIGCLGGIVAIGALGTIAGQLLITAPVAILAAAQYFTTINQPPPTPTK
ncbi:hypothetical protein ACQP0C_23640 [Nocardia sp. CA-129566]|uniref:hypothetical protein n=1 Tax=Nocardia sp. CA-129566 TaxID=3239976 RepID=UPI003D96F2A8